MPKKKVVRRVRKPVGVADFLPPGMDDESARAKFSGPLCTYLLSCDRRGFAEICDNPEILMSKHKGFRALVLGRPGLTETLFEESLADVVGQEEGDSYDKRVPWVMSNRLSELHAAHARKAGATATEKRASLKYYHDMRKAAVAANSALLEAERALTLACEGLVVTHGQSAVVIDGVDHVASLIRERVYWRFRPTMPQDVRAKAAADAAAGEKAPKAAKAAKAAKAPKAAKKKAARKKRVAKKSAKKPAGEAQVEA